MKENEIYLGDAYELIKMVPTNGVDLIITDPPYEMGVLGNNTGCFKNRESGYKLELQQNGLNNGIDMAILNEFVRVLKKINIYIWCNKEQIYDYITYFVKEKGCNWEMIIWAKDNPPPFTCGHYLKDKEYCLYFWERGIKVNPSYETGKTFYVSKTNKDDKNNFLHPTIKDIGIIENLIKNSSKEKDLILDPFVGSGTTCVGAKHLNRKYIGFEINEKYYKIAVDRINGVDQKGQINLFDANYEQIKLL